MRTTVSMIRPFFHFLYQNYIITELTKCLLILLYPHTPHQPPLKHQNTSPASYSDFLPYPLQTQNAYETA